MRMHAAESPKAVAGNAHALEVRKVNSPRIADDHKFYVAFAIDQRADLAAGFVRQLAKLPGKFGRDDLMRRHASLIQLFNAPQLVWFQTLYVAVKTSHSPLDGLAGRANYSMELWSAPTTAALWIVSSIDPKRRRTAFAARTPRLS